MKHKLFVYGTLRYPNIQNSLYGKLKPSIEAKLYNYKKVGLNIVEDFGEVVEGEIYEVNDKELEITDAYESEYYRRFKIETTRGKALVYQIKKTYEIN